MDKPVGSPDFGAVSWQDQPQCSTYGVIILSPYVDSGVIAWSAFGGTVTVKRGAG